ncbi:MAG: hypothetical protein AAGH40_12680 [Verrucomicrobiota bacterium]
MIYNRACLALVLCLSFVSTGDSETGLGPLSSSEADQIIASRFAKEKEDREALESELEKAEVLSEGVGSLPDGRRVIIREVAPPAGEVLNNEVGELPGQVVLTAAQQAWMHGPEQLQPHQALMFSCTVYDKSVTKVAWTYEGAQYLAYTKADFNYLRGVHSVQTDTGRFDFLMGIGEASSQSSLESLPDLSVFDSVDSSYILIEGSPSNLDALIGLEALLEHYEANLESLKLDHQRREALFAAHKRYKEQHPEEPEDFVLQFWVPNQDEEGVDE